MTKTRKTLRGFSFFEVIIYLGLFSMMATALFQFSWDVFDLGTKDRTSRRVLADARFVTERVNYFIRNAGGVDTNASVFGDANGKLVLNVLDSGNTVTIELQNGNIVLTETGQVAVNLNSNDTKTASLAFIKYGSSEDGSEYIDFTFALESAQNNSSRSPYQAATTLQSGAYIRNSEAGL
jgi:hypothetical protein